MNFLYVFQNRQNNIIFPYIFEKKENNHSPTAVLAIISEIFSVSILVYFKAFFQAVRDGVIDLKKIWTVKVEKLWLTLIVC